MTKDIADVRSEFIEKIGLQAQGDGLPRIAGRLLGLLIWDGEAVAFGDLADQLQVSRGSISTATRILEDRRLIRRTAKPGQRQDYFQLSDNPYASMMEVIKIGMVRAKEEIDMTLADIPTAETAIKARVAAHCNFYANMSASMDNMIKNMKQR